MNSDSSDKLKGDRPNRPSAIDLLAVGAIVATVFLIFGSPVFVLVADEAWTLPERAAMKSQFDWLVHLLSFNQTRLFGRGDYFLFRPGLFFLLWLGDFFREQRSLLNTAAVAIYAGTISVIYLQIRRYLGVLTALALTTILIFPARSFDFPNATLVEPYLLAVVFYIAGFWILDGEGQSWQQWVAAAVLLFLSTLFHEFASMALVATAFIIFLFATARPGEQARRLRKAAAVSLTAATFYITLYILNWSSHARPNLAGFFSGETLKPTLLGFLHDVAILIGNEGMMLLPLPHIGNENVSGMAIAVGITVVCALLFSALWFWYLALRNGRIETSAIAWTMAAATIIIALGFIRIVTRGIVGVSTLYYLLVALFLVVILGYTLKDLLPKAPRLLQILLIGIFFGSAVFRGIYIHNWHVDQYERVRPYLETASMLTSYYRNHPGHCHGGLEVEGPANNDFAQKLETLFQYFTCAMRGGKPVYPVLTMATDKTATALAFREMRHDKASSRSPVDINTLKFKPTATTIWPGLLLAADAKDRSSLAGLHVQFVPEGTPRPLYNLGIRTGGSDVVPLILLSAGWKRPDLQRWIPLVQKVEKLSILADEKGCIAFLNDYFLRRLAKCGDGVGSLEFLQWQTDIAPSKLEAAWRDSDEGKIGWIVLSREELQ